MKKNIIENDKIRNSLINLLKLNRKSIQLLKPINIIKKDDDDKLNTSKNDSISIQIIIKILKINQIYF